MLHCGVYSVLIDAEYPIDVPGVEFPVDGRGERRAALTEEAPALREDRYESYPVHARCRGLAILAR